MRHILLISGLLIVPLCITRGAIAPSIELGYAQNFTIETYPTHTILSVANRSKSPTVSSRYALVPRSAKLPPLKEDIQVIRTPVRRVVVLETVFIGFIDALEQLDTIVGAATVDFISQPQIRQQVRKGTIAPLQYGQSLNIENLLLLQPDLILTSISGDPTYDIPQRLVRSELPVVITSGFMEHHPLARAEWIKFIACFYGLESEAESSFERTASRYEALVERAKDNERQPSVFFGAPYSGAWFIPGGNSITAQAVTDAGGRYLWAENESRGSLALDTERVFLKASNADFWINPGQHRSLSSLRSADNRFEKFAAFRTRRVFNNTKQVGVAGGNNIWERGIVYPHEALADLIHIFDPELIPDHELIYFEHLEH